MDHGSRRMGRASASLTASEERAATIKAVTNIVRRLGVVLGAALDASISELLKQGLVSTAETLRDELKPLVDCLVHFTHEGNDDGETEL